jgi:hypothetical protein
MSPFVFGCGIWLGIWNLKSIFSNIKKHIYCRFPKSLFVLISKLAPILIFGRIIWWIQELEKSIVIKLFQYSSDNLQTDILLLYIILNVMFTAKHNYYLVFHLRSEWTTDRHLEELYQQLQNEQLPEYYDSTEHGKKRKYLIRIKIIYFLYSWYFFT